MKRKCCDTDKGSGPHAAGCQHEAKPRPSRRVIRHQVHTAEVRPDYSRGCICCGDTPVVPTTGMCGPCTFGEADTVGGNW